jgi:class 3 adenylate cyclase
MDAVYVLPEERRSHVTAWVAAAKRNLVVEDMTRFEFSALGIERPHGRGKSAELPLTGGAEVPTGPFMAAPLWFRERLDQDTPAMGVIRVTRALGDPPFEALEQRRFFAFADKLSKTIRQARYVALLNELSASTETRDKFDAVAREVPRLIGGKGCSIFVGRDVLEMKATSGALEETCRAGSAPRYDATAPYRGGYTVAAALFRQEVLWNDPAERTRLERERGWRGSGQLECEIGQRPPFRFLAVPILAHAHHSGVIRVPKSESEGPFSASDRLMLRSIADHLGRLMESEERGLLQQFLEPGARHTMVAEPGRLSPRARLITIAYWDIRGFAELCRLLAREPAALANFVQEYRNAATKIVFSHGGALDKFIGDGVMAVFGYLDEDTDAAQTAGALAAVRAAQELRTDFAAIVHDWRQKHLLTGDRTQQIAIACGIDTTDAVVGLVRTEGRTEFSALGPAVNVASRIGNRATAGQILVSHRTASRLLADVRRRWLGSISFRNIEEHIEIYTLD